MKKVIHHDQLAKGKIVLIKSPTLVRVLNELSRLTNKAKTYAKDLNNTFAKIKKKIKFGNYFEEEMMKDFEIKHFSDPALEEELDYLSENEIKHRNEEDNIFTMIRKAKKFEETVIDMNFKQIVIHRLVKNNLQKVRLKAELGCLNEFTTASIHQYNNEDIGKAFREANQENALQKMSNDNNKPFGNLITKNIGKKLDKRPSRTMNSLDFKTLSLTSPPKLSLGQSITSLNSPQNKGYVKLPSIKIKELYREDDDEVELEVADEAMEASESNVSIDTPKFEEEKRSKSSPSEFISESEGNLVEAKKIDFFKIQANDEGESLSENNDSNLNDYFDSQAQ
jgi:hypothetical protein